MSNQEDDSNMAFGQHLAELRLRLRNCVIAIAIAFAAAYTVSERLFALLCKPLINAWKNVLDTPPALHFGSPLEPFFTYFKVAMIAGVIVAMPVIFHQIWCFISPGLLKKEKKYVAPFTFVSALCFFSGTAFGYFLVFPMVFEFLLGYQTGNLGDMAALFGGALELTVDSPISVKPTLFMSEYLSLCWRLLLGFGLVFELPLIIFFLALAGIVTPLKLWRFNRYFVVLSFIISAILTPPDIISQIMMACPLLVLYNLSILLALLVSKKDTEKSNQVNS